jgi:hypothetical protein
MDKRGYMNSVAILEIEVANSALELELLVAALPRCRSVLPGKHSAGISATRCGSLPWQHYRASRALSVLRSLTKPIRSHRPEARYFTNRTSQEPFLTKIITEGSFTWQHKGAQVKRREVTGR